MRLMLEMNCPHAHIAVVNLSAFDLNLLTVFDAVMRERSVTRAGASIGLSQPAVSHALGRLRYLVGDELFVRTPAGMTPTPRAETLAEPLRNALTELRTALEPVVFEPATSDRRFNLALNNYAAFLIAPRLAAAVSSIAPAVSLTIRPRGTLDLAERLDRGDLDLALGVVEDQGERFATAQLLEDEIVVVMREGHPAGDCDLTAAAFAALEQLEISSSLDDTAFIDRWLGEQGLARRIALRAPFISAAQILVQSDLVTNMSSRVARQLAALHGLRLRRPPYRSPPVRLGMLWHRRLEDQPANRWLRSVVRSATADLCEGSLALGSPLEARRPSSSSHAAPSKPRIAAASALRARR
jgi:DNA-binding transcriptional LysR family regulator